ncbi:MAG: carbonic anhydrase family protein [Gammaproteobacteria bacterium]|nr:carbonic anhydrase family protein [Gammaproteobacteria bacterium]
MLKKYALIVCISCFGTAHAAEKTAHGHGGVHWDYNGEMGPEHWGGACQTGKSQSPINIVGASKANLKPIEFNYQAAENPEVVNNGHTIQVNYPAGSFAVMNGKKYNLLQFHFHTPSEEAIQGKRADLVAHLVHKADDGELAVVGVLFNKGAKASATLDKIWANMPKSEGKEHTKGSLNVADLLPKEKNYFHFAGSLTTPPCTEGVQWHVMQSQQEFSDKQLGAFTALFPMNARPLQPLNDRLVEAF